MVMLLGMVLLLQNKEVWAAGPFGEMMVLLVREEKQMFTFSSRESLSRIGKPSCMLSLMEYNILIQSFPCSTADTLCGDPMDGVHENRKNGIRVNKCEHG